MAHVMNIDTAKSYATEENLRKGLERLHFAESRHVVVRTREGRWTAIFPLSSCDGYIARFAAAGFFTLG